MAEKRLALSKDGQITYCTADDDNIGKGRCNHVYHQKSNESAGEFLDRMPNTNNSDYNGYSGTTMKSDKIVCKMPMEDLKTYVAAISSPEIKLTREEVKSECIGGEVLVYTEKIYKMANLTDDFDNSIVQKIENKGRSSLTKVLIFYKGEICGYTFAAETFGEKGARETIAKLYSYVSKGLPKTFTDIKPVETWNIMSRNGEITKGGFVSEEAARAWKKKALSVCSSQFKPIDVYDKYYDIKKV